MRLWIDERYRTNVNTPVVKLLSGRWSPRHSDRGVYFIVIGPNLKIGRSQNVTERLRALGNKYKRRGAIIGVIECDWRDSTYLEERILARFCWAGRIGTHRELMPITPRVLAHV